MCGAPSVPSGCEGSPLPVRGEKKLAAAAEAGRPAATFWARSASPRVSLARVHPVTLGFRDPAQEAAFRASYVAGSWPLVRAALVLGLLQYAAFGWLDQWVAPVAFHEVRAVRVAVCLVIGVGVVATYM